MSRKDNPHTKALLGFIDDTKQSIESLVAEIDHWADAASWEDKDVNLWILRQWQTKLTRFNDDLQKFYRRME